MSELNVYHHELRHNEYAEFCLKYEVDKVIAEKDNEIAELKANVNGLKNRTNLWEYNAQNEPKATTVYDAYWKANSTGEGTGILVYLKSEADKYIKELKEQNHELCQALHSMYSEEEMNYQKYKRCLAMASKCRLRARWFGDNAFYKKEQWALKWHKRWLKLAEVFKEEK